MPNYFVFGMRKRQNRADPASRTQMLDCAITRMRSPGVKRSAVLVRLLQEGVSIKELERVAEKNPWLREELDRFEEHLRKPARIHPEEPENEEERVHHAHLPEASEELEE